VALGGMSSVEVEVGLLSVFPFLCFKIFPKITLKSVNPKKISVEKSTSVFSTGGLKYISRATPDNCSRRIREAKFTNVFLFWYTRNPVEIGAFYEAQQKF
jgi:hypothetical protein